MTSFTPTQGQASALAMVDSLVKSERKSFGILTGCAGTGKTTLLKVVAELHGSPLVLTPTGKAALRVREATGLEACTIHRWLYRATEDDKTGEVRWKKRDIDSVSIPGNNLIILDEASMVSEEVWADIWWLASAVGCRVLLVGDQFQLGPVTRTDLRNFSTLRDLRTEFRADLSEVVRQALDSPIIRASMMIRTSEMQAVEACCDVLSCVPRDKLVDEFLKLTPGSRAVVAHRNATRHVLNKEVRVALGYGQEHALRPGEPLLVLFNNYQVDRFNGEVVAFEKWLTPPKEPVAVRNRYKNLSVMAAYGLAKVEGAEVSLSPEEIFGDTQGMPETSLARAGRDFAVDQWGYDRALAPSHLNANLGYALTCHKAQGSEFNDVLVVVESSIGAFAGGIYGLEGRRHLYTAVTRAKKTVRLCYA